jgi:hypothetical protein
MVTIGDCFIALSPIFEDTTMFRTSVGDALIDEAIYFRSRRLRHIIIYLFI